MEKISLTVEALEAPVRADRYIAEHSDISRSRLKGDCTLLVNGKEAKLSKNVSEGDVISLEIAEVKGPEDIEPQKMDLDIIYEDDNVIVLNKAQGVVVHPAAGNFQGTLVNGLLDYVSGIEEGSDVRLIRPPQAPPTQEGKSLRLVCAVDACDVPGVTTATCQDYTLTRIATYETGLIPDGGQVAEEVLHLLRLSQVTLRLVCQMLQTTLKEHGQGQFMGVGGDMRML